MSLHKPLPLLASVLLVLPLAPSGSASPVPGVPAPGPTFQSAQGTCEPEWLPIVGRNGVVGTVLAVALFDDGAGHGPVLYVGGDFTRAGAVAAANIARWDGTRWSAVGTGTDGPVRALAVHDDGSGGGQALYVGGDFTGAGGVSASHLARWDGSVWSQVGGGTDAPVRSLATYQDPSMSSPELFVGGDFLNAGGQAAAYLARWDGGSWSPLLPALNGPVLALASLAVLGAGGSEPSLVVGGEFTHAGFMSLDHVARWRAQAWHPLSGGTNGPVRALAAYDDDQSGGLPKLYVGGDFHAAGGNPANHVARWMGTHWVGLQSGTDGPVNALGVQRLFPGSNERLYVGGDFSVAGGGTAHNLALWHGFNWTALVSLSDSVHAFAVEPPPPGGGGGGAGTGIYVGGAFTQTPMGPANDARRARGILRLDAFTPTVLGHELNGEVTSLAMYDDGSGNGEQLYVSAAHPVFGSAEFGSLDGGYICRWDGERWWPLGAGLGSQALALEIHDDGSGPALYAGGNFQSAGGAPASRVARWDGTDWSQVGAGIPYGISCLQSYDLGDGSPALLYASGAGLWVWDGSSWNSIFSAGYDVLALAVVEDGPGGAPALYVGGDFGIVPGGVQASGVARWDGTAWSALGLGVDGPVRSIVRHDDGSGPAIYVAGTFSSAWNDISTPNYTVLNIARWNGTTWSSVGGGFPVSPQCLAVYDDGSGPALYATGSFQSSGGAPISRIARWDGISWSQLGSGLTGGDGSTLAVYDLGDGVGESLFVGGGFSAPGNSEPGLARWGGCAGGPDPIGTPYCFGDGSAGACPCANWGGAGEGCANTIGHGARLSASGSASVAAGDMALEGSGLVPGLPGLYFQGTTRVAGGNGAPLGDGLLCAAGSVIRFQPVVANGSGFSSTVQNIVAAGLVSPGDTRTYQLWYRNTGASPCGGGSNLTNGLEITWLP